MRFEGGMFRDEFRKVSPSKNIVSFVSGLFLGRFDLSAAEIQNEKALVRICINVR
jgi:hypothetical protein